MIDHLGARISSEREESDITIVGFPFGCGLPVRHLPFKHLAPL